ncbi:SMC-Scp complex subunit ScpB [Tunicatimonas pelagia]|uniref:SMC-Scp complex subunit ScpB n=1 Tax=Tunicatimonas pelagia TaxID=931531 RepID=UPI002665CB31|nr:SMC-Scp complex subunit ScpB [Tunicatimonas pelagia]WKN43558.1 SMC-Scp complex subunit ScpB [Tunicatimonas pelagia]
MNFLQKHIEALIFCADSPISLADIIGCLTEMFDTEVSQEDVLAEIQNLVKEYEDERYSYHIVQINEGYQFLTKPAYQASISILLKQQSKKRLSTAALETLSIIAYKQPITKSMIEQIRGVGCDYAIQKLLEKSLIEIKGKDETVGRPLLYGTSDKFMEYFGINNLQELPLPKDFSQSNEIGELAIDSLTENQISSQDTSQDHSPT